ncbi:methyltransferase family protein [Chloroflexota bacterium]
MERSQRGFYISPAVLIGANSALLLAVGILFTRKELGFWDGISITMGAFLLALFFLLLRLSHKARQSQQEEKETLWMHNGLYAVIRHPEYTGALSMNFAFLLIFRTWWLFPVVLFFLWLWHREAKHEEKEMVAKHGDAYRNYLRKTGMFFPRLFSSRK